MTTTELEQPERAKHGRRYPVSMMALAVRMYGDGDAWSTNQIAAYIAERFPAPHPSIKTVQLWVNPRRRELHNERRRDRRAQQRATAADAIAPPAPQPLGDRQLLDRMLLLRRTGLTYSAIAKVIAVYHAEAITESQVRARLRRLGVPTCAAKSAAVRRLWAETTTYAREAA